MNGCNGVFTLVNTNSYTYSYKMWKDYIMAITKFTMKISSIPIIGTDIGTKWGAVAIGIGMGSCIGVGVGLVGNSSAHHHRNHFNRCRNQYRYRNRYQVV